MDDAEAAAQETVDKAGDIAIKTKEKMSDIASGTFFFFFFLSCEI